MRSGSRYEDAGIDLAGIHQMLVWEQIAYG